MSESRFGPVGRLGFTSCFIRGAVDVLCTTGDAAVTGPAPFSLVRHVYSARSLASQPHCQAERITVAVHAPAARLPNGLPMTYWLPATASDAAATLLIDVVLVVVLRIVPGRRRKNGYLILAELLGDLLGDFLLLRVESPNRRHVLLLRLER